MYHVSLGFQCIYGCSDESENGDEEGNEALRGRERVEITWPLVYR